MDSTLVREWVDGWAVSRGAAPAVEEPWGLTVDVGVAGELRRHVLPEVDEVLLRKFDGCAPGTWLKLFEAPERLEPWTGPGWRFDSPAWLMWLELRPAAVTVPDGYRLRTWGHGGLTRALVTTESGAFAARAQSGRPPGAAAVVVDQVDTSPSHRRRGLGALLMRTLQNAAFEAGAERAVLGATTDGRALYNTLNWRTAGPLTGLVRENDPQAAADPRPGGPTQG